MMEYDTIVKGVNELLEEEFEVDAGVIGPQASLRDDLELDSLDAVDLVVALEKRFGVRIPESEARSVRILEEVYHFIARNLPAEAAPGETS